MHPSMIITGLCAALAVAKPLQHIGKHAKKDYVTSIELEIVTVYVTVTAGSPVEAPPTTAPAPPPAPPTTVVVVNTVYAEAAPENTPAPAVFAATSPEAVAPAPAAPVPATTAAPAAVAPAPVVAPVAAPVAADTPAPAVVATTAAAPVVAAPVASAAPATDSSYEGVILAQHNSHRANHSANALTYNTTLAGYAKTIASTCVWGHDMTQGGGGYGQNIVQNGQLPWTGVDIASAAAYGITEQWYNGEEPLYASSYGLDNPATTADVLHFTQVVWKATTSVGCFTAQCAQGTVDSRAPTAYTVCNYYPQGNFGGEYAKNVARGAGTAATHATIKWSS